MPKQKKPDDSSVSLSVRFPNALLERVDRFIRWFKKEYPGLNIGRPDVIRLAVTKLTDRLPQKPGPAEATDSDFLEPFAKPRRSTRK